MASLRSPTTRLALRSVSYFNGSADPSGLPRTVSFVVSDGALSSSAATRTITVTPVNDAPVVTTSGGTLAYTENQAATTIDPGLAISDIDNVDLAGATVSITANFAAGQDVLGFANQNGISGGWNAATGVLTLSGSSFGCQLPGSPALGHLHQQQRRPEQRSPARSRSSSTTVRSAAAAATRTVTVTPVNDAPVVATSGSALAYAEHQAATAIDPALTVSELDNVDLAGATVSITGNFAAGQDVLGFTDQNGIGGSWNVATGVLTLSGTSSVANYLAALRSVSYFNGSDDPASLSRTVSFVVNDGALSSAAATRSIAVTPVNDAPVISTSGGSLAYIENQAAVAIDPALTVADLDNTNLAGATASISANFVAGQDVLGFTTQNGITGSWNAATGVLSLSGSASVANYQTALRSVSYFNGSDDPSGLSRSVSFVVSDGALSSSAATRTITVTPVNDAPVVTTSGGTLAYTENQAATTIDPGLAISDIDNVDLAGATVSITANFAAGQDVLGFANQNGISGGWDAATGVLTLSGSSSVANYQAALRSVTYTNNSDDPSSLARTVSFIVTDGAISSTAVSRSVTVAAVNDAPVLSGSRECRGHQPERDRQQRHARLRSDRGPPHRCRQRCACRHRGHRRQQYQRRLAVFARWRRVVDCVRHPGRDSRPPARGRCHDLRALRAERELRRAPSRRPDVPRVGSDSRFTPGTTANVSVNGGTTAFSAALPAPA